MGSSSNIRSNDFNENEQLSLVQSRSVSPYYLQLVSPTLSFLSIDTMEYEYEKLIKENESNVKNINVMRGTSAFNEHLRLINIDELLNKGAAEKDDVKFKRILYNISCHMDAMDITTYWKKIDINARRNYMFKTLLYLSQFHYFTFEDELWEKMDINVARDLVKLLLRIIKKAYHLELRRDVVIELVHDLSRPCCNSINQTLWNETRRYRTTHSRVTTPDLMDTVEKEKRNNIIEAYNKFCTIKKQLRLDEVFKKEEIGKIMVPFGRLYEIKCLKRVHQAIDSLKDVNTEKEAILQCIFLLGEAFNQSVDAPENVNQSPSIAACVIMLRNKKFHSSEIINNISDDYWKGIVTDLIKIAEQIKKYLDTQNYKNIYSLYHPIPYKEKLSQNLVEWLEDDYTYLRDFLRLFRFPGYPFGDPKTKTIADLQPKFKSVNKDTDKQYTFVEIKNIINEHINKLEKLCDKMIVKIDGKCYPSYKLIFKELEKNGNNYRIFLQLSYHIEGIFQCIDKIVQDDDLVKNIEQENDLYLFDYVFIQFCNGRNVLGHHFSTASYELLSSLICLIFSNLKPLLFKKKRQSTKSDTVTLWWYLVLIKSIEKLTKNNDTSREYRNIDALECEDYEEAIVKAKNIFGRFVNCMLTTSEEELHEKLMQSIDECGWDPTTTKQTYDEYYTLLEIFVEDVAKVLKNEYLQTTDNLIQEFKEIHLKRYSSNIDFDFPLFYNRTPLIYVLSLHDDNNYVNQSSSMTMELMKLLLNYGADPNKCSRLTLYPMHYAALVSEEHMNALKEQGAIPNPCDGIFENTAEYYFNNYQYFRIMLSNREIRQQIIQDSFFNRKSAADKLHKSFPNFIIDENYDPNMYNSMGQLPLTCAILGGYEFIYFETNFNKLLEMGAEIEKQEIVKFSNGKPVFGATALLKALEERGSKQFIKHLLDLGANINAKIYEYGREKSVIYYAEKNIGDAENDKRREIAIEIRDMIKDKMNPN